MVIFRLKNLYLSSLVLLFTSCAVPLKYKLTGERKVLSTAVTPLISADNTMLYKAQIFLFSNYYTGLLVHKQTDSLTSHLVFVTEVGMKMFDIEIKKDSLKMLYCFGPMNQPRITKLLEADMGNILLYPLFNKTAKMYENKKQAGRLYISKQNKSRYIYYTQPNTARIAKALVKGSVFAKQKTYYTYGADNLPESVSLKHKGLLRLKIKLSRIKKTND